MCLLRYLDNWLVITDSVACLQEHWDLLLQLCKDLRIIINWEKLDLEPTSKAQHLRMLTYPTDSQITGCIPSSDHGKVHSLDERKCYYSGMRKETGRYCSSSHE